MSTFWLIVMLFIVYCCPPSTPPAAFYQLFIRMLIRLVVLSLLHQQPPQKFMIFVFLIFIYELHSRRIVAYFSLFLTQYTLAFFPIDCCVVLVWFYCLSDSWSFNRDIQLDTLSALMFHGLCNGDWPLWRRNWRYECHHQSRRHSWGCWLDLGWLGAAIYLEAAGCRPWRRGWGGRLCCVVGDDDVCVWI